MVGTMYAVYKETIKKNILLITKNLGFCDSGLYYMRLSEDRSYYAIEAHDDTQIVKCIKYVFNFWGVNVIMSVKSDKIILDNCPGEIIITSNSNHLYTVLWLNSFMLYIELNGGAPKRLLGMLLIDPLQFMAVMKDSIKTCDDIIVSNLLSTIEKNVKRKITIPILKYFLLCNMMIQDVAIVITQVMMSMELDI